MSDRDVDEDAALEVVQQFATAVFKKQSFLSALLLFSDESRREWAHEWVVGELEYVNVGASALSHAMRRTRMATTQPRWWE